MHQHYFTNHAGKNSTDVALSIVVFIGLFAGTVRADTIVPNVFANIEGSAASNAPFGRSASGRFQQVYGASSFDNTPGYITEIRFRPDVNFGSIFSRTTPASVQVYLSTTQAAVDGLNLDFESNLGADNSLVISGPLGYSSVFTGPAGGPKDFDIVLNLATPFLYNPANGNLLMDVRYPTGMRATGPFDLFFDAVNASDDDISILIQDTGISNPSMASAATHGVVTRFSITPVPEPNSSAAAILLATWMFTLRRGDR